jgi:hypothetical protein
VKWPTGRGRPYRNVLQVWEWEVLRALIIVRDIYPDYGDVHGIS